MSRSLSVVRNMSSPITHKLHEMPLAMAMSMDSRGTHFLHEDRQVRRAL